MVVPCGASTVMPAGSERPAGSSDGSCSARNSANDDDPVRRNAGDRDDPCPPDVDVLTVVPPAGAGAADRARTGRTYPRPAARGSLAALLDEPADELLRVALQR